MSNRVIHIFITREKTNPFLNIDDHLINNCILREIERERELI